MDPEIKTEQKEAPDASEPLQLVLNVRDPLVIKYLTKFDSADREERALEALKVGVIAIQSASPMLDTRIVDEKFREVEKSINDYLNDFKNHLKSNLEEHFKPDSGSLAKSFEGFLGEKGILAQLFNQYFGVDGGKIARLMQDHIGPSSGFAKSLDPTNKESVISRIEDSVKKHLQEKSDEIVKQFSLDHEDSALTRLKTELSKEVQLIQEHNSKFFSDLKEALGIKIGQEAEAERGTEKGREFETALYDRVAEVGRQLCDMTDNVRAVGGKVPRSKKGDYVITLGDTSGGPGKKIVIEVKKEQGYKLKDALEELKEARENRDSVAGIFAFAKGYGPAEVGDFHRIGNDFFVTVDEDALEKNQPLVFLESAYKIARTLVVTGVRKEAEKELDIERIRGELDMVTEQLKKFSEMATKVKTIRTNADFIETTLNDVKTTVEQRIADIMKLLV
jgi:hypothetical protein